MSSKQKLMAFEGRERLRELTRQRRDFLIARAGKPLTPTLRRMLLALHKRCRGKGSAPHRWCWPTIGTLAEDLGYPWPQARRTIQRQLERLRELKLLIVQPRISVGVGERGQTSSIYAIRYGALRALVPDYCKEKQPRGGVTTTAGGRHCDRGGASLQPPHELKRSEWKQIEPAASAADAVVGGGGVLQIQKQKRRTAGRWCGFIGDLAKPEERSRIFAAAKAAGWMTECSIDRVRFAALCLQARSRPPGNEAGYLVSHVERGDWSWLDPGCVADAVRRLSPRLQLTPEELRAVRNDEPRNLEARILP